MQVPAPGIRGAKGEEKGKGLTVRWGAEGGGKPNPKTRGDEQKSERRCGTTRDERARDREVPHPQRGVRYQSGVYTSKVLCLTPGDLPAV